MTDGFVEAPAPRRRTRIQREKRDLILEAALEVFSANGFRGSTIDQIAEAAGMSKPNLLYYFRRKEDIHETLMQRLLDTWLTLAGHVDPARFENVRGRLELQVANAAQWRDVVNTYFARKSGITDERGRRIF